MRNWLSHTHNCFRTMQQHIKSLSWGSYHYLTRGHHSNTSWSPLRASQWLGMEHALSGSPKTHGMSEWGQSLVFLTKREDEKANTVLGDVILRVLTRVPLQALYHSLIAHCWRICQGLWDDMRSSIWLCLYMNQWNN